MTLALRQASPTAAKSQRKSALHAVQPVAAPKTTGPAGCACGGGCPRCNAGKSFQAKLAVSQPGDRLEREADAMAEQVLRQSAQAAANPVDGNNAHTATRLSRSASSATTPLAPNASATVNDTLQAPGRALDTNTRAFFEPRFGRDLSDVRVHTGADAARSAHAVQARAYTLGSDVVFGEGEYAPSTPQGKHLLAHELAHVAQQHARSAQDAPTLWRVPIIRQLTSIEQYEWTGRQQQRTARTITQAYIHLNFEPTTGVLICTFKLMWRFPTAWPPTTRTQYISEFVRLVTAAWQDRFPLARYDAGRRTSERAHVTLNFDHAQGPDMDVSGRDYVNWLLSTAGSAVARGRWIMNVHPGLHRDQVDIPSVELSPGSNTTETRTTSGYAAPARPMLTDQPELLSPYQHYFDRGLRLSGGGRSSYRQNASAHEFGHMIGLADEYILNWEDYSRLVTARGQTEADAQLRRRRTASNRIQNIGSEVTRDAYDPFARFLSVLTSQDWRVE
ncbi:MAG TPA: DUF4157 domain-containing protein [Burkholderiales bacterium]|nr:DUF4157 domain-containing protein [Burkholderiales bacterium]